MNESEINSLLDHYQEKFGSSRFEIMVYGRVENMIIKGNILKLESNKYSYQLKDQKGRNFPVYYDGRITHVMNWENRQLRIDPHANCTLRFDFYRETPEEIEKILKK